MSSLVQISLYLLLDILKLGLTGYNDDFAFE